MLQMKAPLYYLKQLGDWKADFHGVTGVGLILLSIMLSPLMSTSPMYHWSLRHEKAPAYQLFRLGLSKFLDPPPIRTLCKARMMYPA